MDNEITNPISTPQTEPELTPKKNIFHNKKYLPLLFIGIIMVFLPVIVLVAQATTRLNSRAYIPAGKATILPRDTNPSTSADVVVVGAGTGGIGAAIQAAKQGMKVLLLEETDWVGGQMTSAGVTSIDGGPTTGIYLDFENRVRAYYQAKGKIIGTCYWRVDSRCFEPSVGNTILRQMLAEYPNITLKLRTKVIEATKVNNKITQLTIQTFGSPSTKISGKVFIEATEYGDLLPLAGVPYRAGNTQTPNLDQVACIQSITYLAIVKKYPQGVPPELVMNTPPPGYDKNLFSGKLTNDGYNGVNVALNPAYAPFSFNYHNAYRGMPDSSNPENYTAVQNDKITKSGFNSFNDFEVKTQYLEDANYRKTVNCDAKLNAIQLLYYIQHELGHSDWSIANDEGYNTPYNREENNCANIPENLKAIERNMPVIPYVREGRRMIGDYTLTGKDIFRFGNPREAVKSFTSSIAVGNYANDLHGCNTDDTLEKYLTETTADTPTPRTGGNFQIPIESLTNPTVVNLLATEKNISQTRLVNGASRLQPITMHTGQAAGSLAAHAIRLNVDPSKVQPIVVQNSIAQNKGMIAKEESVDAPITNWAWAGLQIALTHKLINYQTRGTYNYTIFPNQSVTRAELAKSLAVLNNLDVATPPTKPSFSDVPTTHPAYKEIEAVFKAKITSGCTATTFCPDTILNRDQMAVFTVRTLGLDYAQYQNTPSSFTDIPNNYWAKAPIEAIKVSGIITGCTQDPLKYCPTTPLSRAHTWVFFSKILSKKLGELK